MTVLSSLYSIIMGCAINVFVHVKNIVGELNETNNCYLKVKM